MNEFPSEVRILENEAEWMDWLLPKMEQYSSPKAIRKAIFEEIAAMLAAQIELAPENVVKNFETAITSFRLNIPFPVDMVVSEANRILEANNSSEAKNISEKMAAAQGIRRFIPAVFRRAS